MKLARYYSYWNINNHQESLKHIFLLFRQGATHLLVNQVLGHSQATRLPVNQQVSQATLHLVSQATLQLVSQQASQATLLRVSQVTLLQVSQQGNQATLQPVSQQGNRATLQLVSQVATLLQLDSHQQDNQDMRHQQDSLVMDSQQDSLDMDNQQGSLVMDNQRDTQLADSLHMVHSQEQLLQEHLPVMEVVLVDTVSLQEPWQRWHSADLDKG